MNSRQAGDRWRPAPAPPPLSASGERGIALVVVLWILTSLTILVLSFNASVRSHLDVATSEIGMAHADAATSGAVRLAVLRLLDTDKRLKWPPDGRPRDVNVAGRTVRIAIQDESGFIDINKAPQDLLEALLMRYAPDAATARILTARIIDWRDEDHEETQNGAEDNVYLAAGRPAGAADRPFAAAIELQSVLGFTPDLVARLLPEVTIYGGRPTINVLTAPRSLLLTLPEMTTETADSIIRARQNDAKPEEIAAQLQRWQKLIGTQTGPAYRLHIDVIDPNIVASATEVTVLILPQGNQPFHILEWREVRPIPR